MEILAYGVQVDEKPLLRAAFAGQHELRLLEEFLNRNTAPLAAGYEVVSTSVNAELDGAVLRILAAGGTRMIAQRSTGFNNIDLEVAAELGLTVARVSYYSPYAVAEFAWTLAMAVNRRLIRAANRTREFDFRLDGLMGRDIHGMTVGVIGTGKIGECFARIAHGFGTRLLGWDVAENPCCRDELGMKYTELEVLLAESDIADDTLARLMTMPNVLVTSHQAYFTDTAVGQIVDATVGNVEDYLSGRRSENTLVPVR
ncbi:NAD(P)-dependent oxidoreductase [Nocardia sp. NBC_00511]|uniref:NAD(P)-dependent oxidoreductase n=1 Tax=Nocardia sp. NBC_00511 TaxID=2903591 RepID=UPI0030E44655